MKLLPVFILFFCGILFVRAGLNVTSDSTTLRSPGASADFTASYSVDQTTNTEYLNWRLNNTLVGQLVIDTSGSYTASNVTTPQYGERVRFRTVKSGDQYSMVLTMNTVFLNDTGTVVDVYRLSDRVDLGDVSVLLVEECDISGTTTGTVAVPPACEFGCTSKLSCTQGYTSDTGNSVTATCLENSKWSTEPGCYKIECDINSTIIDTKECEISNCSLADNNVLFNNTTTVTCTSGGVSISAVATCNNNESLSAEFDCSNVVIVCAVLTKGVIAGIAITSCGGVLGICIGFYFFKKAWETSTVVVLVVWIGGGCFWIIGFGLCFGTGEVYCAMTSAQIAGTVVGCIGVLAALFGLIFDIVQSSSEK